MVALLIRNTTLILALAIPTGIPMTLVNQEIKKTLHTSAKTSRVQPA